MYRKPSSSRYPASPVRSHPPSQDVGSLVRQIPVALHDLSRPANDLADLARWERPAFCIHYADLDAVQWPAARQQALGVKISMLLRPETGDPCCCFGQAVKLGEPASEYAQSVAQQLDWYWRGAIEDKLKRGKIRLPDSGALQQK